MNACSPILPAEFVARAMMSDGAGRIVNVASIVAFTRHSGLSVYAATKSSMIGFTPFARAGGGLNWN